MTSVHQGLCECAYEEVIDLLDSRGVRGEKLASALREEPEATVEVRQQPPGRVEPSLRAARTVQREGIQTGRELVARRGEEGARQGRDKGWLLLTLGVQRTGLE
jgi:hypothetical protein